jgi:hypothetical protein
MTRKALVLLAPLAFAASARAQIAAYGTVTLNSLGGLKSSPYAESSTNPTGLTFQSNVNPIGGTFGGYYDFKTLGPIRLGVDARGVITDGKRGAQAAAQGSGVHIGSGLAGVRLSFHTPLLGLKPYVEGAAGLGRSDFGFLINSAGKPQPVSNLEYHVFAGADLRFLPIADWRVVELGYGALDSFGTNSHTYPLRSVSTGIVLHLPTL